MMNSIYKNIKKEYIFQFIRNTSMSEAIWMLFLAARGMSLVQIGLLESIYHLTGMVMEVPTGFIADRYGRKVSRIIGRIMGFLSSIVMLGSHSFMGFAIGFVLTALSFNLESGSGDALIYDSLAQCGREGEFMKVRGRNEVCFQSARLLSLVAGGIVATKSYELAYVISAGIHLIALGLSFTFEEPSYTKNQESMSLFNHMGRSLRAAWDNRQVLPYILHLEAFSLYCTTLTFYFQSFLKSRSYQEYQIGIILAATSMVGVLMATLAYKIEQRLGEKNMIILTGTVPGLLFLMMAFTNIEPVALLLISVMESLMFVVFGDYINKRIPSEHRATLLSFESMIFSIMMIVFFPVIGAISEHYGFKQAFGVMAGLCILTGGLTTFYLLSARKRIGEGDAGGIEQSEPAE